MEETEGKESQWKRQKGRNHSGRDRREGITVGETEGEGITVEETEGKAGLERRKKGKKDVFELYVYQQVHGFFVCGYCAYIYISEMLLIFLLYTLIKRPI